MASGTWEPNTRVLIDSGILSVNRLEILASAVAVFVLDKVGKMPCNMQVALRGDRSTACNVANTGIAYSLAMRFRLGVFVDV